MTHTRHHNSTRAAWVLGAGVHRGVMLQLGRELQLQSLQALLPQCALHVLSELDLLCKAQDLHTIRPLNSWLVC